MTTQELLNAVGALAEVSGVMLRQLMKNGFTRREAVSLVQAYLTTTIKPTKQEEQ